MQEANYVMKLVQKGVDEVKAGRVYSAEAAEEMFNAYFGRKK